MPFLIVLGIAASTRCDTDAAIACYQYSLRGVLLEVCAAFAMKLRIAHSVPYQFAANTSGAILRPPTAKPVLGKRKYTLYMCCMWVVDGTSCTACSACSAMAGTLLVDIHLSMPAVPTWTSHVGAVTIQAMRCGQEVSQIMLNTAYTVQVCLRCACLLQKDVVHSGISHAAL